MPAFWLIALLTLGGVGLYLAMPGGRLNAGRAALVLLAGAGAALIGLVFTRTAPGGGRGWLIAFAILALLAAVRVITHRRAVYSALYFVLVVVAVAGMLLLLQAEFLAVALLIIYAGAILVTYVFVIMLAQQAGGPPRYDREAREPFLGCATGFLLLALLAARFFHPTDANGDAAADNVIAAGRVANIGTQLLTQYWIAMEVAGVLLLAAMVGAIAIARRRADTTDVAMEGDE